MMMHAKSDKEVPFGGRQKRLPPTGKNKVIQLLKFSPSNELRLQNQTPPRLSLNTLSILKTWQYHLLLVCNLRVTSQCM